MSPAVPFTVPLLSLLSLLLAVQETFHVVSSQSVPSGCSVVLGDLNPADFPVTGYGQPSDTTILFDYTTPAGSTVTATTLATELLDSASSANIRLAIFSAAGVLIAQGAGPITTASPISAGIYTVPLAAPLVLQPSTTYYIAQLTSGLTAAQLRGFVHIAILHQHSVCERLSVAVQLC